ncbi:MAG: RNA polymerase sigma factor RpoD/SigA, partial [Bacteroidales bacterium]|nr:RNA polymerase sigma factor RpoD/SigA [Bacteroidales bacterium]
RQLKITKSITNRNDNSLYQYLQDIRKEPLITADEEVILAQRIKNGDKIALKKLVKSNLRFVVSVAKQYQNQGLPLQDLINEGNLGLIKAAERFDETRGFKFISFAVWWIRQSILQAIAEQSRMVRLPLHQVGMLNKVKKERARLEQKYERPPSDEEIADALDVPKEKLMETVIAGSNTLSVDAPLLQDEEMTMIDTIEQDSVADTDDIVMKESLTDDIADVLSSLNDMERGILYQYFGLGHQRSLTLDEIAERNNITRERVRKIKERALTRLRKNEKTQKLTKYLCQ